MSFRHDLLKSKINSARILLGDHSKLPPLDDRAFYIGQLEGALKSALDTAEELLAELGPLQGTEAADAR